MWEKVLDQYCERGADPAFWGEPLNAVTNAGFIIAGFVMLASLMRGRPRDERALSWILMALMLVIGVGSFLFHTMATRWASLADTIPILLFILAAVFGVFRRGFGAPLWLSLAAIPGFFALAYGVSVLGNALEIDGGLIGYGPALIVLLVSGFVLAAMARPGGGPLIAAGLVFVASLTLRTLDKPWCQTFSIGDWAIGAHWAWHLLNAVVLYLVAYALIRRAGRAEAT